MLRLILAHVRQVATTAETSATVSTDGTEEVFRLSMDGVDYALARSVLQSHQQSVGLSPREQAIIRLIIIKATQTKPLRGSLTSSRGPSPRTCVECLRTWKSVHVPRWLPASSATV